MVKKKSQKKSQKKIKGGEMSDADYFKWLDTHNVETYAPKTPQEKKEYQDIVNKQQEMFSKPELQAIQNFEQDWEEQRQKGYNDRINSIESPEQLYNEAKSTPDQPNIIPSDVINAFINRKIKIDDKYHWNPYIWGSNQALQHLYDTVPRPKKHTWADSFFEGLTAPFALAAKLPIPGLKDIGEKVTQGFKAIGAPTLF